MLTAKASTKKIGRSSGASSQSIQNYHDKNQMRGVTATNVGFYPKSNAEMIETYLDHVHSTP